MCGRQHVLLADERTAAPKIVSPLSFFLTIAQKCVMRKLAEFCLLTTSDQLDNTGRSDVMRESDPVLQLHQRNVVVRPCERVIGMSSKGCNIGVMLVVLGSRCVVLSEPHQLRNIMGKTMCGRQHVLLADERTAALKLVFPLGSFLEIAQKSVMWKLADFCILTTNDQLDNVRAVGSRDHDRCR
uniref:Uncharacterized protein n=1 Tax=Anopheles dirus TaxID=7168 RepID=A0A182N6C6_9DIPT